MADTCAPEVACAGKTITLSPRLLVLPKLRVFVLQGLELRGVAKLLQCEELKARNAPSAFIEQNLKCSHRWVQCH